MVNYHLGKIYRIVNSVNSIEYIGSTVRPHLSQRMGGHQSNARGRPDCPLHQAMKDVGIGNFTIKLIQLYPCNSKDELEAEEYRLIKLALQNGQQLYNTMIDRKHSEETKALMCIIQQRINQEGTRTIPSDETKAKWRENWIGRKSPRFGFGCLSYKKDRETWSFHQQVDGKRVTKAYQILKYGPHEARRLAEAARQAAYPDYTPNEPMI
jgi:group I intron endonuclease